MKKNILVRVLSMTAILGISLAVSGCSKTNAGEENQAQMAPISTWEPIPVETPTPEPEPTPEEEVEEVVEGCYRSELTNEWIDENLEEQRPLAVMVDNERSALPHFGVNACDVVYEIMNSTENDRVTRLMCVVKDYENIEQLGSIRSTRPTNFMLAGEYDAILIHDGGPFYNKEYYNKPYVNNLSGGFARFINGKALEFTEYVTPNEYTNTKGRKYDGVLARIEEAKYSRTYTENYSGPHFVFSNDDYSLSDQYSNSQTATYVQLPMKHNGSELKYNAETKTYDYYTYGNPHVDALYNDEQTTFKNVIVYSCGFAQLDANGYLIYNVIGSGLDGWYLTDGEAIPIYWSKDGENAITQFKSVETQEDITLNTGKTYIAIVPDDSWESLVLN